MECTVIECPGCGNRVEIDTKKCPYCRKPIIISAFDSVRSLNFIETSKYISSYKKALNDDPNNKAVNLSIAMCFLKLKQYDRAQAAFNKAIEDNFENSEAYFYAAVSSFNGKKAFLAQRPIIDKALENVKTAMMIEPRGIYALLTAYIKYDYFFRKSYSVAPDYRAELATAKQIGYSVADAASLFELLGVEKPAVLN